MAARLVKDWKKSFEESTVEELAIEHDVPVELLEKIKSIVEKTKLPDDVLLCVGDSTDQW